MAHVNRRNFLRSAGALSFLGGTGVLSAMNASRAYAADTSGYKALVCIFLKGGMDYADVILPYDQPSYDALTGIRQSIFTGYDAGDGPSSRARESLLPLNPVNAGEFGGRQFAMAPEWAPVHALFQSGDAAIVGGVGPLIEPVTRTQMDAGSVAVPARLFSHNDQQSTWMSGGVEGSRYGWGGRFADAMLAASPTDPAQFVAISASGNDVFLSGENARQFQVASGGPRPFNLIRQSFLLGSGRNSDEARRLLMQHFGADGVTPDNFFEQDIAAAGARVVANNDTFSDAYENGLELATEFPNSSLGRQLRTIAETIAAQGMLNVSRQVFYAATGGYDTHSNQTNVMPNLNANLAQCMAAFQAAMRELNVADQVTLFTASDFGRTLIDNGDGTDHGWGAHHFIVGGAVQGGRIYGEMAEMDTGLETYTRTRGRLIPGVAVDQYAAALGRWFGLDDGELAAALPNLGNFDALDLGFVA